VDALAEALHRAASDEALRATLIARGFERVKGFTWERAARQLLEIYQLLAYNRSTTR
jgi:glycosyltransferase involved in cell wall biosynthesis